MAGRCGFIYWVWSVGVAFVPEPVLKKLKPMHVALTLLYDRFSRHQAATIEETQRGLACINIV